MYIIKESKQGAICCDHIWDFTAYHCRYYHYYDHAWLQVNNKHTHTGKCYSKMHINSLLMQTHWTNKTLYCDGGSHWFPFPCCLNALTLSSFSFFLSFTFSCCSPRKSVPTVDAINCLCMDQIAPRTTTSAAAAATPTASMTAAAADGAASSIDTHAAAISKPFFKSTQPPRSNLANASVSHVTTSAEITNPSASNSRVKSVPIPPPLLLKRPLSRSSMSSVDDDYSSRQSGSAASLPPQVLPQTPGTASKPIPSKKRSMWTHGSSGDEMASSLGSESDTMANKTRTSSTTSPMYSLRYTNSPPAGSGGKYMIKSKRSSWIVDAGAERGGVGGGSSGGGGGGGAQTTAAAIAAAAAATSDTANSTPSTPVSLPETVRFSRSRKSSTIDENNTTRSKLRENNLFFDKHQRASSISSILTDNISVLSGSDEYESCHDNEESATSPAAGKVTCWYTGMMVYSMRI